MRLGTNIADLQLGPACDLVLYCNVILRSVLCAHVRLEFTEEQDGFEQRPVNGRARLRIENTVGSVGQHSTALVHVGSVEQRVERGQTDAEWRLGAELFQHELLNRVVKQPPASANAGLAIAAGIPCDADAGSERFVVRGRKSIRDAFLARKQKARRKRR